MTSGRARRLLIANGLEWKLEAACTDEDTKKFFVKSRFLKKVEDAKKICRQCPVRRKCLDYAVEIGAEGIWGGTTQEERERVAMFMQMVALTEQSRENTQRELEHPIHASLSFHAGTSSPKIHNQPASPSASVSPISLRVDKIEVLQHRFVLKLNLYPPGDHVDTPSGLSHNLQELQNQDQIYQKQNGKTHNQLHSGPASERFQFGQQLLSLNLNRS